MGACIQSSPEAELSLLEIFGRMARVREFEQMRLALGRAGRLPGNLYLALGQEATAVGLTAALTPGDRLFPSRRGLALRLAAGLPVEEALRAAAAGPGLTTPAGHLPIAVGAALAARLAGEGKICLVELGDGAASQGLCHESLQMAAGWEAPVIVACIQNNYAGNAPSPPRATEAVAAAAAALGLPVARVDGQDAAAVRDVAQALGRAIRARPGPALIECRTYRLAPHVLHPGSAATDPRPASEIDFWRNRDPLRRCRALLIQSGLASPDRLDRIAAEARTEVAEAARRVWSEAGEPATVSLAPRRPDAPGAAG